MTFRALEPIPSFTTFLKVGDETRPAPYFCVLGQFCPKELVQLWIFLDKATLFGGFA